MTEPLVVDLDDSGDDGGASRRPDDDAASVVCGSVRPVRAVGGAVAATWLSEALGRCCSLVESTRSGFANDAASLLVISRRSVSGFNRRLAACGAPPVRAAQFRANVVVSESAARDGEYAEDDWRSVAVGPLDFGVTGGCARCAMIELDAATGRRAHPSALKVLSTYRRDVRGAVNFGIYVSLAADGQPSAPRELWRGAPVSPR